MRPSVVFRKCMQPPTPVYAGSNFLTCCPGLIWPHKKIFLTHCSRLELGYLSSCCIRTTENLDHELLSSRL
jgi:hypothetical protein